MRNTSIRIRRTKDSIAEALVSLIENNNYLIDSPSFFSRLQFQ